MSNSRSSSEIPPPLELECLDALWRLGEANVHQVRELLLPKRELAYTTVMTLLDRLEKRGNVVRHKTGRSFTYRPNVTRGEIRRLAISQLVDRLFDGSIQTLSRFLEESGNDIPAPAERPASRHAEEESTQSAVPSLDPSLL